MPNAKKDSKKPHGKEERRARKAAANRDREGRKMKRGAPLDRSQDSILAHLPLPGPF